MIDTEMLFTLVALVLMWPALYVVVRVAAHVQSMVANVHTRLRNKVNKLRSEEARKVVAILVIGPAFTLMLMYILGFFDKSLVDSIELATIAINNFITPTLLALSVFLLFKTWSTSKKELDQTQTILRKKEELDLVRYRIGLLNQKLDSLPSRQFSYWVLSTLRELNNQHQVTYAIHSLLDALVNVEPKLVYQVNAIKSTENTYLSLCKIHELLKFPAPTIREIISSTLPHSLDAFLLLIVKEINEKTNEELKTIFNVFFKKLHHDACYSLVSFWNKHDLARGNTLMMQDIVVFEMSKNIDQLIADSKYTALLKDEYRFHFSSLEVEGLENISGQLSL
ncbi:hypothetical protein [Pseudoalteromonas rubra]|uniref:hypothetical protein n=1 Tax=Pseudoalteromonas rubra TaxID=43658 RepID=UPI002DB790C3|nr:hypothetical protein [Pseudoalteromonas rubra]MEC4091842.1 hypothetical protein [Pseudoalteromonas rubra]